MNDGSDAPLQQWLDKAMVAEVVQTERAARDQAQWSRMRGCFHPHSTVEISWFQGSGLDFVAASERLHQNGVRSLHQMAPTIVRVQGEKALAETGCAIVLHGSVSGVKAFITSYARMFTRLRRHEASWLIAGLRMVYIHDQMTPTDAQERLTFDRERLNGYRASYRHVCYLLSEGGQQANETLPGEDKPETVTRLLADEHAWLADREEGPSSAALTSSGGQEVRSTPPPE